jgi:hypothetical protein
MQRKAEVPPSQLQQQDRLFKQLYTFSAAEGTRYSGSRCTRQNKASLSRMRVILTRSFDDLYEKGLAESLILVGIAGSKTCCIGRKGRRGDVAEGATKNVASGATS